MSLRSFFRNLFPNITPSLRLVQIQTRNLRKPFLRRSSKGARYAWKPAWSSLGKRSQILRKAWLLIALKLSSRTLARSFSTRSRYIKIPLAICLQTLLRAQSSSLLSSYQLGSQIFQCSLTAALKVSQVLRLAARNLQTMQQTSSSHHCLNLTTLPLLLTWRSVQALLNALIQLVMLLPINSPFRLYFISLGKIDLKQVLEAIVSTSVLELRGVNSS